MNTGFYSVVKSFVLFILLGLTKRYYDNHTDSVYNHMIHTLHTIRTNGNDTICRNHSQPFILTTYTLGTTEELLQLQQFGALSAHSV